MKEKTLTDFALQKLNFRIENIVGWIYVVDSHFNGIKWRKRNENAEKKWNGVEQEKEENGKMCSNSSVLLSI